MNSKLGFSPELSLIRAITRNQMPLNLECAKTNTPAYTDAFLRTLFYHVPAQLDPSLRDEI